MLTKENSANNVVHILMTYGREIYFLKRLTCCSTAELIQKVFWKVFAVLNHISSPPELAYSLQKIEVGT